MKTVRFANVIRKSGKPEIYLPLSADDPDFQRALKSDRVMSLVGASAGSKTTHGEVGYDKGQRAQLLIFPKSLESFADSKIVGIDYDSFAEPRAAREPAAKPAKAEKPSAKPKAVHSAPPPKTVPEKPAREKVIHFPEPKKREKPSPDADQLQAFARQALRALEKNNSVAAYNLLKRMVGED